MLSGKRLLAKLTRESKTVEAVAHPYRLAVLYLCTHESMRIRELSFRLSIPENLVVHHVNILLSEGFLKRDKIGSIVSYRTQAKMKKRLEDVFTELFPAENSSE